MGLIASRLTFPPLVGYLVAGYVLHGMEIAALPNGRHWYRVAAVFSQLEA
jgi:glutathione-regulated potassium-efflux system ancillary protein KefC